MNYNRNGEELQAFLKEGVRGEASERTPNYHHNETGDDYYEKNNFNSPCALRLHWLMCLWQK